MKTIEERIDKALEESEKTPVSKEYVCSFVKQALDEMEIEGNVQIVHIKDIEDDKIPRTKRGDCDSVIFIQFSQSGHVAVVGAGKDYVSNPLYCGRESTPVIMEQLREKKGGSGCEDFKFDVDSVILVTLDNLTSEGYNHADKVLESRNGIEQYIGEYLAQHDVAILNFYQHWNYNKSIFELLK